MRREPLEALHAGGGVCPAAVPVRGAADALSGCICGVMLNDSRRADSILEGMTPGVYLAALTDPSTLIAFCFGDGVPKLYPEQGVTPGSYTQCPVWAAERDLRQEMERVFAMEAEQLAEFDLIKAAEAGEVELDEVPEELRPFLALQEEELSEEEAAWIAGAR